MTARSLLAPRVSPPTTQSFSRLARLGRRVGGIFSALSLSALACMPAYANSTPKVMALHVEGTKITPDLRNVLDDVIAAEFKRYGNLTFVAAPNVDMIELMLELECVDFDVDCFSKLGARFQVDQVVHAEISKQRRNDVVRMRIVDVAERKSNYDKTQPAKAFELIPEVLRAHIVAAYGEPQVLTTGTLTVEANSPNAAIYLGQEFLGSGSATATLPEGEYLLRVTSTGTQEVVRTIKVVAGKTTSEKIALQPVVVEAPEKTDTNESSDTSWIVWTTVGVVVVAGAITAILLATGSEDGASGPATIGVGNGQAWRDGLTAGGRR